jgi:hypothetical protein
MPSVSNNRTSGRSFQIAWSRRRAASTSAARVEHCPRESRRLDRDEETFRRFSCQERVPQCAMINWSLGHQQKYQAGEVGTPRGASYAPCLLPECMSSWNKHATIGPVRLHAHVWPNPHDRRVHHLGRSPGLWSVASGMAGREVHSTRLKTHHITYLSQSSASTSFSQALNR